MERNKTQSDRFSESWCIKKYGNEEGKLEWEKYKRKMDRGSLKYFNNKYGDVEGKKRYKQKCELSNNGGMRLFNLIFKHGEIEGVKRYKEWLNKCMLSKNKSINYSKISQGLFWNIYQSLPEELRCKVKFAELNQEQMFKIWKEGFTVIFVDFKIGNAIIEFQGTYWHKFLEVKEKDIKRCKILEEYGYKTLFIEQKEYEDNKINV